ncbi:MAG: DUF2934 domain-containing protein [Nitrospira sp.]
MKRAQPGKMKPSEAKPKAATRRKAVAKNPTREEIERRAYELYLMRGCEGGHADEDWLQAERELRASQPKKK